MGKNNVGIRLLKCLGHGAKAIAYNGGLWCQKLITFV